MIKQIEKSASKSPGPSPGLLPTPNIPPVAPYSLERPVLSGAPANLNKPNSSLLNKVVEVLLLWCCWYGLVCMNKVVYMTTVG